MERAAEEKPALGADCGGKTGQFSCGSPGEVGGWSCESYHIGTIEVSLTKKTSSLTALFLAPQNRCSEGMPPFSTGGTGPAEMPGQQQRVR